MPQQHKYLYTSRPLHPAREFEIPVYSITLGPGVIRYLKFYDLANGDIHAIADEIRSYEIEPTFNIPQDIYKIEIEQLQFPEGGNPEDTFESMFENMTIDEIYNHENTLKSESLKLSSFTFYLKSFLCSEGWVDTLEKQKSLLLLFLNGVPLEACQDFHETLSLKELNTDSCVQSYVRTCGDDEALARSYRSDSSYMVAGVYNHAFKINDFVKDVFSNMEQEKVALRGKEITRVKELELSLLRQSKYKIYLYLMQDLRNERYKIGKSKNPNMREKTLQSEQPSTVLRMAIPAPDTTEKHLHAKFSAKRVRGEWFEMTNIELVEVFDYLSSAGDMKRAKIDFTWLGEIYFNSKGEF